MEAYENFTYEIGDNLYINLTSKCTNACTFCVRNEKADYFGHKLWLSREPSAEEVLARSAIMQYFDNDTNAAVNEMWEEIKGLPIPGWAYIVIAAIAAGIVVIALTYVYKGKRREAKPKKGYRRVG